MFSFAYDQPVNQQIMYKYYLFKSALPTEDGLTKIDLRDESFIWQIFYDFWDYYIGSSCSWEWLLYHRFQDT